MSARMTGYVTNAGFILIEKPQSEITPPTYAGQTTMRPSNRSESTPFDPYSPQFTRLVLPYLSVISM